MEDQAVIMARVSSKEQEDEGFSIDAQIQFLNAYCSRNPLKPSKTFRITETASKHEQRYQFSEMLQFLSDKNIPNLVIEKVDRATRNSKSAVEIDEWLSADPKRKLHLPKNSLILHKNSTSQDRFMWDIHIAVAKQYANNLREEVKKGVLEKLRQGWYPGTIPPVGYIHTGLKGQKIQTIDAENAGFVKLAFKLYSSGNHSVSSVCNELKNQGFTNVYGNSFSKSYVHKMLRNKFYIGVMTWEGVEYRGNYEPIIDDELFWAVQQKIDRGASHTKPRENLTLLKGKANCTACGSLISWYEKKGHWYGECKAKTKCSIRGTARLDRITDELAAYFQQLKAPAPEIISWVKDELKNVNYNEHEQHMLRINRLTKDISRIESQLNTLYEDRLDNRISTTEYDRISKQKNSTKHDLESQLEKLMKSRGDNFSNGLDILDLTQRAATIFKDANTVDQRILLSGLFSAIYLNGNKLSVDWRPEANIIREAVENTSLSEIFLEPQVYPKKKHLTKEVRSIWLRG